MTAQWVWGDFLLVEPKDLILFTLKSTVRHNTEPLQFISYSHNLSP